MSGFLSVAHSSALILASYVIYHVKKIKPTLIYEWAPGTLTFARSKLSISHLPPDSFDWQQGVNKAASNAHLVVYQRPTHHSAVSMMTEVAPLALRARE